MAYLKPHGALYNRVVDDADQAAAVLAGSGSLPVLGLPGSAILRLAEAAGRTGVREGFPDRGYTEEGRLVPRDQPGALVEGAEAIAANAVAMAAGGEVQSLCVHGDSPGSGRGGLGGARALRRGRGTTCGPGSRCTARQRTWLVQGARCPQEPVDDVWTNGLDLWIDAPRICGRRRPSAENGRNNLRIALVPGLGRRVEISHRSPQGSRWTG